MRKLLQYEEDVLKEAGNIGAGKASNALCEIIDKEVDVSTTNIKPVLLKDINNSLGNFQSSLGVLFDITGDIHGSILLLSSKKTSKMLVDLVKKKVVGTTKSIDQEEQEVLKELGNILVGSYLTGISTISKLNLLESTPKIFMDDIPQLLNAVVKKYGQEGDQVLLIETKIVITPEKYKEDLILILTQETFGKLFHAMVKESEK